MNNCKTLNFEMHFFSNRERELLIRLICNEQTHRIVKDYTKYESDDYKEFEKLKVKIKNM